MHVPICILLLIVGFRLSLKLKPIPSLWMGAGIGLAMGLMTFVMIDAFSLPLQFLSLAMASMAIVSPAMWLSAKMEGYVHRAFPQLGHSINVIARRC